MRSRLRTRFLTLELIRLDGKSLHDKAVPVGDILQFGWIPVFSESAHKLLVSEGALRMGIAGR